MRSAHSLPYVGGRGVFPDRDTLDKDLSGQRSPGQRPPSEQNHIQVQKHYLPWNSFAGGNNLDIFRFSLTAKLMYILGKFDWTYRKWNYGTEGNYNETGFVSILDLPNTLKIFQDMVNVIIRLSWAITVSDHFQQ